VLYLLFSVGFTTMNRFVTSAGGFYPISSRAGPPARCRRRADRARHYNAIDIAVYGMFGFFSMPS